MSTRSFPILALLVVTTLTLAPSAYAEGHDIDVTGSLAAGASNREGDGVGHASLRGRYAFWPSLSAAVTLIAGAAEDDERTVGGFVIAAELGKTMGRWRPAVRAGFVHQHETARADAEKSPITVTLGFDEAIRHRTGAAFELGGTVDLKTFRKGALFAAADLTTHVMFDDNGPRSYVLLGLGVGYRFDR